MALERIRKWFSKKQEKPPEGMSADTWEHVKRLSSRRYKKRADAAYNLGLRGNESAIPFLTKALHDPEWNVRMHAAGSLGRIGHESAVPPLIKALRDPEEKVRRNAAEALGEIRRDKRAVPELVKALYDPQWKVRAATARALGMIEHESAIPHLAYALHDPAYWVRSQAAMSLGWFSRRDGDIYYWIGQRGDAPTPELLIDLIHHVARQEPDNPHVKALELLQKHIRPNDSPELLRKLFHTAVRNGKLAINEKNVRLYVKQIRALEGKVK